MEMHFNTVQYNSNTNYSLKKRLFSISLKIN